MSMVLKTPPETTLSKVSAEVIPGREQENGIGPVYEQYYKKVYALCLRITQNAADAEDVAQDVFVGLCTKLKTFRGDSKFSSWLYRVTINQVFMRFRKKSYKVELTTETGEMPESQNLSCDDSNRIALAHAIARLPNGYRKIFCLHDVEGYEHQEIAQMLGISAGTSKSQLHKARMRLRQLLLKKTDGTEAVPKPKDLI